MDQRHGTVEARSGVVRLDRRRLVQVLAAAGFSAPVIASILSSGAEAQNATPSPAAAAALPEATPIAPLAPKVGLINPADYGKDPRLIKYDPADFGTPLGLVDGLNVPNPLFFIRSHGPTAFITPEEWRLKVTGEVNTELNLSLADLQALPQRKLTAFLECSGDSRSRFVPKASGTPWGNTAIGNAVWTGVSLATILDKAGVKASAVDVVSQGGDFGGMQRGLPIAKTQNPETMLVWEMNGQALPVPNGGPVRLFVPGWGGIASTKWIVGLQVIDHAFLGQFNRKLYVVVDKAGNAVRPVQQMPVKSVITAPAPGATLSAGRQTVAGYAWSGYGAITGVEVSTDGGASWAPARVTLADGPYSWVRFETAWDAKAGTAKLQSRATDAAGYVQPATVPWNKSGYQMNAIDAVALTVT